MLQKFQIGVDIHFYFKHGVISSACASILDFLAAFQPYLNQEEVVKLLSTCFYLLTICKFGQCYLPDYALRYFGLGFGQNYRDYESQLALDILKVNHNHAVDLQEETYFDEDEREIIEVSSPKEVKI